MEENSNLVSINYTSNYLGVSKDTLRNWDNNGTLKAIRIGNRGDRRYDKKELEGFLKTLKGNDDKEIDLKEIHNYLEKSEFWFQEAPGTVFTLQLPNKFFTYIGRFFNPGIKFCAFSFTKDYFVQALNIKESIENCKAQFKMLHENPKKMQKFLDECKDIIKKLEKTISRVDFIDFSVLSKNDLLKEYDNFNKDLEEFWIHLLFMEHYDPYSDNVYIHELEKIIGDKKLSKEIFATMTFPGELSFVASERASFLRLITENFNLKEKKIILNSSNPDYLADIKYRKPKLLSSLKEHQERFFWTQLSYAKHVVLGLNDYLDFIREIVKEADFEKLKQELYNLENQDKILREKREKVIQGNKIPEKAINELNHFRTVAWLKDERKRLILMFTHNHFRFAKEFVKRSNVDLELMLFARIKEIPNILENNFNLKILQERREDGIGISWEGKQFSVLSGNDSKIIKEKIFPVKESNELLTEFHGTTASKGDKDVVIGKARVILSPDGKDIKEDEILVTSMTRPDFMPLMKKALAFVTDEGGITCHAAIVSRELNKPCIIGTKNATKSIHDGDEIEMRMNHGIVKIIRRAK